jgi:hypothetical protein
MMSSKGRHLRRNDEEQDPMKSRKYQNERKQDLRWTEGTKDSKVPESKTDGKVTNTKENSKNTKNQMAREAERRGTISNRQR